MRKRSKLNQIALLTPTMIMYLPLSKTNKSQSIRAKNSRNLYLKSLSPISSRKTPPLLVDRPTMVRSSKSNLEQLKAKKNPQMSILQH